MSGARDKIGFSGQGLFRGLFRGLFAKYVIALVGLVVFVLAVNGVFETWISYRATKTALTDAMSEKAEATAKRIEQSISDLERQISWVTRASADTLEKHRNDYTQLLNGVPAVSQLALLSGQGRELLRLSRTTIQVNGGADFSRDTRFTETVERGVNYAPADFRGSQPHMSISVSHSGFNAGVTVADIDLGLLSDFLGDAQVGKATFAYVTDSSGKVLASSAKGPDVGADLSALPQVAALMTPNNASLASGTDADNHSVLAAAAVPKLGWTVFFEQPTAQALAPIRDQLVRIALLIALGLAVAILAGTLLARRMLIPITALSRGARRLGAGDFQPPHRRPYRRRAGRTRQPVQPHGAVSSSLDLNAVLPTVAARALEITHADAVLIYGYDAAKGCFNLAESIGIDKAAQGEHLAIDQSASLLGEAASKAEPIAIPDLADAADQSVARPRDIRRLSFGAGGAAGRPDGVLGSLVVLRQNTGEFSPNLIGLIAPSRTNRCWRCATRGCSRKWITRAASLRPRTPPCASRPTSCRSRPTN
jgi:hypothetical protein